MADERFPVDLPSSDNWTMFKIARGGGVAVVAVNDGLRDFKERGFFPWHLVVSIDAQYGSGNLPTEREEEWLQAVGHIIETRLIALENKSKNPLVLYLARSTWNGVRELIFRVHDAEYVNAVLSDTMHSTEWPRSWRFEAKADKDWAEAERYFELYPRL
jgi:Family of unknown function (DUF695)